MRILNSLLAVPLLVSALATSPAFAEDSPTEVRTEVRTEDSVVLTNGRTITGRIVGEDERFISIRSGGVLRAYAKVSVASIERGTPLPETDTESTGANSPGTDLPGAGSSEPADAVAAAKAEKKRRRAERKERKAEGRTDSAPLSAQGQAWLTELINRLRSPAADDPMVRRSLGAAVQALGPGALAAVRDAADETEGEVASTFRRIAAAIESRTRGGAESAERGVTTDRAPAQDGRRTSYVAALGLRREQAGAVKDVLREHVRSRRRLTVEARSAGTPRDEVGAQLAALRVTTAEALRAVLDEEQAAKLDAIEDDLFEAIETRQRGADGRKKAKKSPPQ